MSKPTEFWKWFITDEWGRRRKTSWRMTRVEALQHDPNAEPVPGTMEIRNLPETPEEMHSASGLLRKD